METSSHPSEGPQADVPPPSLGSCLVNVIAAPGDVFERLRPAPARAATWLVPGLILVLVGWIGSTIIFSQDSVNQQMGDIQDKALQRQVEKGKLNKEQASQAQPMAEKIGVIVMKVITYAVPVWLAFITPFWWGFLLWLIGRHILKGTCSYSKAVEVVGLANVIEVLAAGVRTLLVLATGNFFAGTSPALLVPNFDPGLPAHAALMNLDLMTFWVLAIYGLGIAKVSGVAAGKAMAWTFGFWASIAGVWFGLSSAIRLIFGG
jgi:hypothetical protein